MTKSLLNLASILVLLWNPVAFSQIVHVPINAVSKPLTSEVKLTLIARHQRYNSNPRSQSDHYDKTISSPKSALILDRKNKFYINSLEGYRTSVYDLTTFKRLSVIKHRFGKQNSHLFQETTLFDYRFRTKASKLNTFNGKPVEGCFSHNGKYLWVTYYRRSFDVNAIDPSAVAIIDTDTDSIVRVMPTAPLPKMIACSPKYVAVTHWGDNTVGMIDISSGNVNDFKYVKHFVVGHRLRLNYSSSKKINRDSHCGYCLRGTVFSPDNKYLLVGRMGRKGGGGIAIFDIENMRYLRTVLGMQLNLRHLVINGNTIFLSTNQSGYVQKTNVNNLISFAKNSRAIAYRKWQSRYVGKGVRTIVVSSDGQYIFAAVNNKSKIAVIRSKDMKIISSINVDSFPVGMGISHRNNLLIVTSQGKSEIGGGNSVMIFKIE